jgi:hypothetical protein
MKSKKIYKLSTFPSLIKVQEKSNSHYIDNSLVNNLILNITTALLKF